MNIDITDFSGINEPIYILEEKKLRNNLKLISNVAKDADIEIILAFKSYALWKTFPIFLRIFVIEETLLLRSF